MAKGRERADFDARANSYRGCKVVNSLQSEDIIIVPVKVLVFELVAICSQYLIRSGPNIVVLLH